MKRSSALYIFKIKTNPKRHKFTMVAKKNTKHVKINKKNSVKTQQKANLI